MNEPASFQVTGPAELVALVPNLLGFTPEHSLVTVALDDYQVQCTFRVDLPAGPDRLDDLTTVTGPVKRNGCNNVVLIAFGDAATALASLDYAARVHQRQGITVLERLRVTDGRWYNPDCHRDCCPPDGRPVLAHTMLTDAYTIASGPVLPDRTALARLLDPVDNDASEAVAEAIRSLQSRRGEDEVDAVQGGIDLIDQWTGREDLPGADDVARLALAVADKPYRDRVLAKIAAGPKPPTDLWLWVTRHLSGPVSAPPATIAGYCAYRRGNGVLAAECLFAALVADPDYQLAGLLLACLNEGIPPDDLPVPAATGTEEGR